MVSSFDLHNLRFTFCLTGHCVVTNYGKNFVVLANRELFRIAEIIRTSANRYYVTLATDCGVSNYVFKTFKECIPYVCDFFKRK